MQRRVPAVMVLAFSLSMAHPKPGHCWGWIGHRLITRLALGSLPQGVRAFYGGLDAELDAATVHPDTVSMVDPHEAARHYVNVEVLDPGFREVLQGLPPAESEPPSPPPPAPGAGGEDGGEPHHGPHHGPADEKLRQAELDFFRGKMPFKTPAADAFFAALPESVAALDHAYPEAQQRAIGTVDYQPEICYAKLVSAMKARDTKEVVFWTGKLSHYLGDSTQPLHNTVNHDGKITGNLYLTRPGPDHSVHSRFEAGLLKFMGDRLEAGVKPLVHPAEPLDARQLHKLTTDTSRGAYALMGDVLKPDEEYFKANPAGERVAWEKYYAAMEPKMGPIAMKQLAKATQQLANALLTAHTAAGSPRDLPPLPAAPAVPHAAAAGGVANGRPGSASAR